jgi:hypothetical protein
VIENMVISSESKEIREQFFQQVGEMVAIDS